MHKFKFGPPLPVEHLCGHVLIYTVQNNVLKCMYTMYVWTFSACVCVFVWRFG